MGLILVGMVIVAGLIAFGLLMNEKANEELARRRAEEDARERERRDALARRRALVLQAEPLVSVQVLSDDVRARAEALVEEADELRTFDEATDWDARAGAMVDEIQAAFRALDAAVASFSDAPTDDSYRVERTRMLIDEQRTELDAIRESFDRLTELIDLTPADKKEQTALLRELRAEKKDLQLRKREVRQGIAEARRAARTASVNALEPSFGGYVSTYDRRMATHRRREIRAALEAHIRPHETEATAFDRQINAMDRRIEWLRRFGED